MKPLLLALALAGSAFAGDANINIQGTENRQYISMWTEKGYVDIEVRKQPVTSILITDDSGKVILDTYFPKTKDESR